MEENDGEGSIVFSLQVHHHITVAGPKILIYQQITAIQFTSAFDLTYVFIFLTYVFIFYPPKAHHASIIPCVATPSIIMQKTQRRCIMRSQSLNNCR